jgi:guanylate kinase
MYKIIAIIGKAGSGKDTILQKVLEKDCTLHEIVSCTTRPPREGEIDGINYFFLDPETFGDKVLKGEMLEATCFNDWFYGTGFESLRSDIWNIGVFNPAGIESLLHNKNVDVHVFYVQASDKTRLLRQLNRESDPDVNEIIRRFRADMLDFDGEELDFRYEDIINETESDLSLGIKKILELAHETA